MDEKYELLRDHALGHATPEERKNAEDLLQIYEDGHTHGWNEAIERVALWHEEKAKLLGAEDDIEWRVASDKHTRMAATFREWKLPEDDLPEEGSADGEIPF